jgi:hypothetical protein
VDILTFSEDPAYLGRKLFPQQREIMGEFFSENAGKTWEELILICGRDSTKTFIASIIASYLAYLWLEIPDPYYLFQGRIDRGKEVSIICVALKQEQATILLDEIKIKIVGDKKNNIAGSPYFRDKIVSENSLEIVLRKNLHIQAVTSNSASEVGKTAIAILFDEIGKYGTEQGTRDGEEVYDALMPSLGRFASNRSEFIRRCAGDRGLERIVRFLGRAVSISTPMAEEGILWRLFQSAQVMQDTILLYHRPTWEMNPNYPLGCAYLETQRKKDPAKYNREYGAQFEKAGANPMFPPELIDQAIAKSKHVIDTHMIDYGAALDTAKNRDAFCFCIGHMLAGRVIIDEIRYWVSEDGHRHNWTQIEHEVRLLCMQYRVEGFAHDGYESEGVRLHFHNFMLDETPFTGKYKMEIYDCLEARLYNHEIEYPGDPRLLGELKAIQRKWNGDKYTVHHPDTGDVRNDEGPDVVANVTYRLYNRYVTTREGIDDETRHEGSIEWPNDRRYLDDRYGQGNASRWPAMIAPGQDHMEE